MTEQQKNRYQEPEQSGHVTEETGVEAAVGSDGMLPQSEPDPLTMHQSQVPDLELPEHLRSKRPNDMSEREGHQETNIQHHPDVKAEKNAAKAKGEPDNQDMGQMVNPKTNANNWYK